jgi:CRP-like cAMP-binding protein
MKSGDANAGRSAARLSISEVAGVNAILNGLGRDEMRSLTEHGSMVTLKVRTEIYAPEMRIDHVYFPIDCVLSVVTRMQDGNMIEIGTVGREGVSAIPLLLGATTTANECYAQVPGRAIKIDAAQFLRLREHAKFRQLLDRYVQAYVNMLGQLAACNRLHSVYERCARWLLMTQDRVGSERIELTHEYLAMMLGTQRSGVTIAAGTLQHAGFIKYGQGVISILDREGLEGASCECYEVAQEQFGGLLRNADDSLQRVTATGRRPQQRRKPRTPR